MFAACEIGFALRANSEPARSTTVGARDAKRTGISEGLCPAVGTCHRNLLKRSGSWRRRRRCTRRCCAPRRPFAPWRRLGLLANGLELTVVNATLPFVTDDTPRLIKPCHFAFGLLNDVF